MLVSSNKENLKNPFNKNDLLSGFIAFIIIILLWELLTITLSIPQAIFPGPLNIVDTSLNYIDYSLLIKDCLASLTRVLVGFFTALLIGGGLGLLLGSLKDQWHFLTLIIEIFRPISPIAWIPLAILWFGVGELSAYWIIFIACFFPIFTNTYTGAKKLNPLHIALVKSLSTSRKLYIKDVLFPNAVPYIFSGIKIAVGFGWMAVIASEMIAAQSGLGYMIQINRLLMKTDMVIVGMIVIALIGFVMNFIVRYCEKVLVPWANQNEYKK